jgi:glutamine cyclotransferase
MRFPVTPWLLLLAILGEPFLFPYVGVCETIDKITSHNTALSAKSASFETSRVSSVPAYKIVNVYPHDTMAFTQGLAFEDGVLFEGTGLHGRSTLRKTELETGRVLQVRKLPAQFFGEGITVFGDKVIQLTWRSNVGFVYDKVSLELLTTFKYPTEGWGLTHDGQRLIMSDGTSTLHFLDPETLKSIGQVEVYDTHGSVNGLNELEYIKGEIYANVWPTDSIVRIRPETGQVMGRINLEGLLGPVGHVDVLNGIAYDMKCDRLFVTGKMWPKLFEVELGFHGKGKLKE